MFASPGSKPKSASRLRALKGLIFPDGGLSAVKLAGSSLGDAVGMINGTLVPSVAASALTVAVKTLAGADPSAADPVLFVFRSATAATGDYTVLSATAALSIVISSGSTLGTTNATAFRIWVVVFNDGGVPRLGVINCLSGTGVYPLGQFELATSSIELGIGLSDSSQTFYTTSAAVTSKAYAVLGYMNWETGLATAGTWSAGPTRSQLFRPWTPLPGAVIQQVVSRTGASATGSTVVPNDDTIPQNTEGDQYMSQAVTPTSAANLLHVQAQATFASTVAANRVIMSLYQDTTANALATIAATLASSGQAYSHFNLDWELLAALTAATTFKVRAGPVSAATVTFNGEAGARVYGGALASYLRVREMQA